MDESLLRHLESKIEAIEARNMRVESAKAWETSWTRVGAVGAVTYFTMVIVLWTIDQPNPLIHAMVPTAGFLLSSLSLPIIREWWVKRYLNRHLTLPRRTFEDTL